VLVDDSIAGIGRTLAQAGNYRYGSVIIPRAAHDLTVGPSRATFDWWRHAPGLTVSADGADRPSRARWA
jgi:hypothetical protein